MCRVAMDPKQQEFLQLDATSGNVYPVARTLYTALVEQNLHTDPKVDQHWQSLCRKRKRMLKGCLTDLEHAVESFRDSLNEHREYLEANMAVKPTAETTAETMLLAVTSLSQEPSCDDVHIYKCDARMEGTIQKLLANRTQPAAHVTNESWCVYELMDATSKGAPIFDDNEKAFLRVVYGVDDAAHDSIQSMSLDTGIRIEAGAVLYAFCVLGPC